MAQAKSGFSTEGTQYAVNNSYYLLDTVPGAGSVIEGPVTVTGNLLTTGNEIIQGALSVAGNITAPGVFQVTGAAAPLALVGSSTTSGGVAVSLPGGSTGAITLTGAGSNSLTLPANGNINLLTGTVAGTPTDVISIGNAGAAPATFNGVRIKDTVGGTEDSGVQVVTSGTASRLVLQGNGSNGVLVTNTAGQISIINGNTSGGGVVISANDGGFSLTSNNTTGAPLFVGSLSGVGQGITLTSGLSYAGSYSAPISIGASYIMTTNKAFLATNSFSCTVFFPANLGVGEKGVALINGLTGQNFAPISVAQNGVLVNLGFAPAQTNFFSIVVI